MKREPVFKTEAELCAAFIEWAKRKNWTCYPETAGFDILVVMPDQFQIGVEAKLRINWTVIQQALPKYQLDVGPDYRAVLVPDLNAYREVLPYIGLACFYCTTLYSFQGRHGFATDEGAYYNRPMFDWNPVKRCKLPEYMPDVPAGVPGPVQLTPWKVGALRLLARLELHGSMTRKQVNDCGLDPRRWCSPGGWLIPDGGSGVRNGRWSRGKECPAFDQQHPDVYAQILAEETKRGPVGQQDALVVG